MSPNFLIWEEMGSVGSTPGWMVVRGYAGPEGKAHVGLMPGCPALQQGWIHTSREALLPTGHVPQGKGSWLLWGKGAHEKAQHLHVQINPPVWPGGPWEMA